jgi:competence protein ComEA
MRSIIEAASSLTRFQVGVIMALVVLLLAGTVLSYVRSRPRVVRVLQEEGISSSGGSDKKAGKAELAVHVAGAVNSPGLYHVPEGSRVADALDKAGGPRTDALLDNLNLAAKIKDGEKVLVPRQGETTPVAQAVSGDSPDVTTSSNTGININIAGLDELDKLPGVGPALARRIIEYRQKNGQFSSVDELDNVEGIGPSKLESLKDLVTI